MSILKAAWVQGRSRGEASKNAVYYEEQIRGASARGAKLIVLPELFLWDYFPIREDVRNFDTAVAASSSEMARFVALAAELAAVLVLPFFERRGGVFHNSCLVVDSTGKVAAHYRKMHIPDDPGFSEKFYFTPGDIGFVTAQTSAGTIGPLICWDQWFPEAARIVSLKGARVIVYPTAIAWDDREPESVRPHQLDAWITVMRSHAITNGVHVMAVNRVGREGHLTFWGNSFLADPFGRVIARDGEGESTTLTDIDLSQSTEARRIWPFLRDRRANQYDSILKLWDE